MDFRCGWYTYPARFWQTWQRINQMNHARQCLSWTRKSSLRVLWYRTSIGTSILFWNIWKFDTGDKKMGNLLKSRKFWLLILDTVISLATFFLTKYASPEAVDAALVVIGSLQPVFVIIIAAIAYEDGQALAAGAHPGQLPEERPCL